MGNALGNFKEYWDEINSHPRMLGGFIWDWVDQGIILSEELRVKSEEFTTVPKGAVLYGGDFGDKPNLHAFCMNGVVMSDRTLTPKYYEVQAVYGSGPKTFAETKVDYKPKTSKDKAMPAYIDAIMKTARAQVFRAPTDNDKSFGNWLAKDWKRCGLDTLTIPMKVEKQGPEMTFTFTLPDGLPEIPRIGIHLELPRDYEQLTWYGRGPWDNYPDRKVSCPIGLWKSTVSQQYVHYPRPQDSGNHEDCQMVELKTKKGQTLRIEAVDKAFSFSALPYSAQYLASKTHDYELEEEGKTFLSIDCAVMGLGNSSCGPGVLKKYTIDRTKKYQLKLRILR
jgi:beta-galactosidase